MRDHQTDKPAQDEFTRENVEQTIADNKQAYADWTAERNGVPVRPAQDVTPVAYVLDEYMKHLTKYGSVTAWYAQSDEVKVPFYSQSTIAQLEAEQQEAINYLHREYASKLEQAEASLAEMQRERDAWKRDAEYQERDFYATVDQLAACQKREAGLREALNSALGYVRSLGAKASHPLVQSINAALNEEGA